MSSEAFHARRSPEWRSDLRWIGASLALHALVVFVLLGLSGLDPRALFRPAPPPAERWKAKSKPVSPSTTADTLIEVRPFEGISWETFTRRRADRSRQSSTANAVLAKLKGLKFGSGTGGAAVDKAAPSTAAPIEIGSTDGPSLGALVGRQEYAVRRAEIDPKAGARKMTDAERAELKKRFRELERHFRKAFAEALNDDPELRVTVSFESEVGADGRLNVRSFRAKGRYRPESLEKLKAAMQAGIGGVRLANDLAGTVVRGESVFVK
jgi:hypothetical protein